MNILCRLGIHFRKWGKDGPMEYGKCKYCSNCKTRPNPTWEEEKHALEQKQYLDSLSNEDLIL